MSEGTAPPVVLPAQRWMVVPKIANDRAHQRIWAEICEGAFRPPDAREASRIEALHAIFVPFWRFDIARVDEAQRLEQERLAALGIPPQPSNDPTTGWMVCAASVFPFEIKHPASILPGDTRPVLTHPALLQPGDPDPRYGWEVLDADVDEITARALAHASFQRLALDPSVLLNEREIVIQTVHFVRYPVWFARYRHRVHQAPSRDGLFYVGISAVDETPITALHPSKLAAGAAKIRKLFGI
jgi:hypothetical protein